MEKSATKRRYYFDYNATAPLLPVVEGMFSAGARVPFANPSSIHGEGRESRRVISQCRGYLHGLFGLETRDFHLFFHSGATEATNTLFKSLGLGLRQEGVKGHFFFSVTDHPSALVQRAFLESLGHSVGTLGVDSQGNLREKDWGDIPEVGPAFVNWTWVNNETGVVSGLDKALSLKKRTGAHIFVDAVQSVGKVAQWTSLESGLDAYTYSGHKFGALKGVGFTFLRRGLGVGALHEGGGQQEGLRSGTENVLGIMSVEKALEFVVAHHDHRAQCGARDYLETRLEKTLGPGVFVVGRGARVRAGQTTCLVFKREYSDITSMAFDLAGMDVSAGSACHSGARKPSSVLLGMGLDREAAQSAIRLSFSPFVTPGEMEEYSEKILAVAQRFV